MFRVNFLRNSTNLAKQLFIVPQQNTITHLKSPLSNVAVKCPLGRTGFNHVKPQKSLLQVAKAITPKLIQSRGAATGGDHVRLWQMEKIAAAALVPLFPGIFLIDSKILETLLSAIVVIHTHWGFEAIITDYLRPSVVGPLAPKIGHVSLNFFSALTMAGLLVLIYSGNGIAKSIKKGWAIGKN